MKKILLPLGILIAGAAMFFLLRSMRQPPQRLERPYRGPLVEAIAAPAQKVQVVVEGQGTVQSIELIRNGRVIQRHFPEDERSDVKLPGRAKCRIRYGWGPWKPVYQEGLEGDSGY